MGSDPCKRPQTEESLCHSSLPPARPGSAGLSSTVHLGHLGARDDHERGAVASLRRSGQCTASQRSVIRGGYDRLMRQLCLLSGDTNSSMGDAHPGVRRLDRRDGALGATARMGPLYRTGAAIGRRRCGHHPSQSLCSRQCLASTADPI